MFDHCYFCPLNIFDHYLLLTIVIVDHYLLFLAMLLAFIWNGGVNAAIGRTSSFYMFQWSFSLASVACVERITVIVSCFPRFLDRMFAEC